MTNELNNTNRERRTADAQVSNSNQAAGLRLKTIVVLAAGILACLSDPAVAQAADDRAGASLNRDRVLVEIDGAKLTIADIEMKRPGGLFHARSEFYDLQKKAVEEFVNQYLLERQAQREGTTVNELLERHAVSTLPKEPSEESLRVFYEGINANQPYEAVRDQILATIRQRRLEKAANAYTQSLRGNAKVVLQLDVPRAQLNLQDTPIRGDADAPVLIVEYADYECRFCQDMQPTLDRLEAEYKGKLTFAFKEMPLPIHPHAQKASEAARCAGAQGRYWDYHDLLFKTKQLEVPQLKDAARELKLEAKTFDECLDSGTQVAAVKAGAAEAQNYHVEGTPSFFINGRFFGGAGSYEFLKGIIEEELRASSARAKDTAMAGRVAAGVR